MYKSKKAFTIIELIIGIAILAIIMSGTIGAFKHFFKAYIMSEENPAGEIYHLAYDIQRNKLYTKKIYIEDEGKLLKMYRSPTCYLSYRFNPDTKEIAKKINCPDDEKIESDNNFIVPNIETAKFKKTAKVLYMELNATNQNFSHDFAF